VKVLLADVMEGSIYAASDQCQETLHAIYGDAAAIVIPDIFIFGMAHHVMGSDLALEHKRLYSRIVEHHLRPSVDVLFDNGPEILGGEALHHERAGFSVAVDKGNDWSLIVFSGLYSTAFHLAADVGFVNLDGAL
jgi:hypothetical protein